MRYTFRAIAYDETRCWDPLVLPAECKKVFGVYFFRPGEATHCCSMSGSTWCEPIENVFCGLDPEHPFYDEHQYTGMEEGIYVPFITPPERRRSMVSASVAFDADNLADAWELARDWFHGNVVCIPGMDRAYAAARTV
ncbi:MAG TPA: hypothetical protein VFQ88_07280 [Nevskiaceae bacterium]|nr:hypothetical protein [Nevskiaceae bacterium]